jgi:hypothetical protein
MVDLMLGYVLISSMEVDPRRWCDRWPCQRRHPSPTGPADKHGQQQRCHRHFPVQPAGLRGRSLSIHWHPCYPAGLNSIGHPCAPYIQLLCVWFPSHHLHNPSPSKMHPKKKPSQMHRTRIGPQWPAWLFDRTILDPLAYISTNTCIWTEIERDKEYIPA